MQKFTLALFALFGSAMSVIATPNELIRHNNGIADEFIVVLPEDTAVAAVEGLGVAARLVYMPAPE